MKPLFIVLEGPDGSGTTKHTELLAERFRKEGKQVFQTAEPSSGPIGKEIRRMLQDDSFSPDALQLMFTADRADHLRKEILPALDRGEIVICDRYIPSTIVYGKALGLSEEWLHILNEDFLLPQHLFFALPPFEVCKERVMRRDERDSLETDELMKKVYGEYTQIAKDHPPIHVIDTSGEKEAVHEQIWQIVKNS